MPLSGALSGSLSSGVTWQGAGNSGTGDSLCVLRRVTYPPSLPQPLQPAGGGHRSRADLQPLHSDSLNFSGSVSPQGESKASEEQNAINERL